MNGYFNLGLDVVQDFSLFYLLTAEISVVFFTQSWFCLQEALKVLRLLDDQIIYELNKSVPTVSFAAEVNAEQKCRELYSEVVI